LLEAADVPATVFVVAGQLHSRREFWWDDLERILLSPPMLPDQLSLTVDGRPYAWHFKPLHGVDCSDQRWHVLMESEPTPRQTAYLELAGLLRRMDYEARERLLARLAAWAGLAAEGRPAYRALTTDEMNALAHDGLVEVGAHTMTHPMLSTLAGKTQRAEIVGSKRRLEEALDRPVTSFSYPYGSRSDYTRDVVEMVKEAGFRCACSNFAGAVMLGRDPYQLPRFLVRDWDGDEFARRLTDWFVG
jgi:peptidoglycan/xylan/chitin deacetylase (PgdA/CDA1 family)